METHLSRFLQRWNEVISGPSVVHPTIPCASPCSDLCVYNMLIWSAVNCELHMGTRSIFLSSCPSPAWCLILVIPVDWLTGLWKTLFPPQEPFENSSSWVAGSFFSCGHHETPYNLVSVFGLVARVFRAKPVTIPAGAPAWNGNTNLATASFSSPLGSYFFSYFCCYVENIHINCLKSCLEQKRVSVNSS